MKNLFLTLLALSTLFFTACEDGADTTDTGIMSDTTVADVNTEVDQEPVGMDNDTMRSGNVVLYPLGDVEEFSDAELTLNSPEDGANIEDNAVQFDYDVSNYELTAQTEGKGGCDKCANSENGQHIHVIYNNNPYIAKYEPEFEHELEDGHYVVLSFLSRSYHNSVKNENAFDVRQFTVGNAESEDVDLSKPLMFYSRPKGTYTGEGTEQVLLDFYLVNTDLEESGRRVRATINGNEFMINKWQPYVMEGLETGENTITLELLNEDGELVDSEYNQAERTITLEEGGEAGA